MRETPPAIPSAMEPAALAVAVGALGGIAFLTSPELGHFRGALIPWPAHGLSAAIIMAAPPRRRPACVVAVALALFAGLAPVALRAAGVGGPVRLVAAVALLVAQALVITLLYHRLAGSVSPLSGTTAYARMALAVVIGALPTTAVASALVRLSGGLEGAEYSGWAWWTAAATSGAALIGITFALAGPVRPPPEIRGRRAEFALLALVYGIALASAFAEVGPFAGHVTPAVAALPFLAWAGLRHGTRGFAVASLLLIVAVTASTWLDIGPFGRFDEAKIDRFRRAWIYLAALVGPAMIFPVAIEEREAADRRTRLAFAQLRALFQGAGDPIAAVDRELVLLVANPAWCDTFERLTGIRPALGQTVHELHAGLGADGDRSVALWQRALAGEAFTVEREFGDPARGREAFEVTYAPLRDELGGIVGASHVVRSISERRRREAQDAEARRLEGLGRLAGGVAHDFNNLMMAVGGYAELLLGAIDTGDARRDDVLEIQAVARRAAGLTQQLLAFARQRAVEPRDVDVAEHVRSMAGLLRPLLGARVTIAIDAPPAPLLARIDPTQLEQVVLNLVVNARDAMPSGGRVEIRIDRTVDADREMLELVVRDSGEGMPAEVQARIFEPFFTTKAAGKGTGLGLSTVHGIVHQAGGTVKVESAPGRGTTFRIELPAVATSPTPAPAPDAAPRSAPRTP